MDEARHFATTSSLLHVVWRDIQQRVTDLHVGAPRNHRMPGVARCRRLYERTAVEALAVEAHR